MSSSEILGELMVLYRMVSCDWRWPTSHRLMLGNMLPDGTKAEQLLTDGAVFFQVTCKEAGWLWDICSSVALWAARPYDSPPSTKLHGLRANFTFVTSERCYYLLMENGQRDRHVAWMHEQHNVFFFFWETCISDSLKDSNFFSLFTLKSRRLRFLQLQVNSVFF